MGYSWWNNIPVFRCSNRFFDGKHKFWRSIEFRKLSISQLTKNEDFNSTCEKCIALQMHSKTGWITHQKIFGQKIFGLRTEYWFYVIFWFTTTCFELFKNVFNHFHVEYYTVLSKLSVTRNNSSRRFLSYKRRQKLSMENSFTNWRRE